jgi:hypothetical protein
LTITALAEYAMAQIPESTLNRTGREASSPTPAN